MFFLHHHTLASEILYFLAPTNLSDNHKFNTQHHMWFARIRQSDPKFFSHSCYESLKSCTCSWYATVQHTNFFLYHSGFIQLQKHHPTLSFPYHRLTAFHSNLEFVITWFYLLGQILKCTYMTLKFLIYFVLYTTHVNYMAFICLVQYLVLFMEAITHIFNISVHII
jgi:hypothetical protein